MQATLESQPPGTEATGDPGDKQPLEGKAKRRAVWNSSDRREAMRAMPWDKIRAAYASGVTYSVIADTYGMSVGTLKSRASREGWAEVKQRAKLHQVAAQAQADGKDTAIASRLGVLPSPPSFNIETLIPGDREAEALDTQETGALDTGNQGDRGSGDKLANASNLQQGSNSLTAEISALGSAADLMDGYLAREVSRLCDGAVIAKPKTLDDLAKIQSIMHKAARGWRKEEAVGGSTLRRCARVPARETLEAEIVGD